MWSIWTFFVLNLENLVCNLHLRHISIWISLISSFQLMATDMDSAVLEGKSNLLSSVVPCTSLLLCSHYLLSPLKNASCPLGPERTLYPLRSPPRSPQATRAPISFCIIISVSNQDLGASFLSLPSATIFLSPLPYYCFTLKEQQSSWIARSLGAWKYLKFSLVTSLIPATWQSDIWGLIQKCSAWFSIWLSD